MSPSKWTPTRKVSVAALAGAVSIIAAYVLSAAFRVNPPPEVIAAGTVLVTVGLAYLIPESDQA
jgi:hypothetical protein